MKTKGKKQIIVIVDEELHSQFKSTCTKKGQSITGALRLFMKGYGNEE